MFPCFYSFIDSFWYVAIIQLIILQGIEVIDVSSQWYESQTMRHFFVLILEGISISTDIKLVYSSMFGNSGSFFVSIHLNISAIISYHYDGVMVSSTS